MVSVFYIFEEVLLESQASGKAFHDHLHHLMAREHEVQHLLPAIKICQSSRYEPQGMTSKLVRAQGMKLKA